MGMSASQARLLQLQARQSNLEYQGQQINQERTILSQQCTSLYNSLLEMQVPTPPSTSDYTTIEYTGVNGATTFTLGLVKPSPSSNGNYIVEIKKTEAGPSIDASYGSYIVDAAPEYIYSSDNSLDVIAGYNTNDSTTEPSEGTKFLKKVTPEVGKDYYTFDSGSNMYKKISYVSPDESGVGPFYEMVTMGDEGVTFDDSNDKNIGSYVLNDDYKAKVTDPTKYIIEEKDSSGNSTYRIATANDFKNGKFRDDVVYYDKCESTDTNAHRRDNSEYGNVTVGGSVCYDFDTAKALRPSYSWGSYETAITNKFGTSSDDALQGLGKDDFYVYFSTTDTGKEEVNFVMKTDVSDMDGYAQVYKYSPNGKYTTSEEYDDCKLQFDVKGRITSIGIPIYNTDGEVQGYTNVELTAATKTDENAYKDAYNKYEYAQYEYDKKQQEINHKTEIIQQEDRNLELKLQRLDNERSQITTEIEAVDKVIKDNIESSYKTFSG